MCVWRRGGWEGGMYGYMGGGVATRNRIIHNTLHGTTSFKASGACPGLANGEQGEREAVGCGREGRGGRGGEGGEGGREGGEGKRVARGCCLTKEVSCNVVTDNHGDREEAPEESLKNILSDKVGL